jgi:hypothetical protein
MGETAYNVLAGGPVGKRPLGGSRLRLEDNIKMDLKEIGWEDLGWIHLAHNRDHWWALMGAVMLRAIKCVQFL